MKDLDEIATLEELLTELKGFDLKSAIGTACLWECCRLKLLPISSESMFGFVVMQVIESRGPNERHNNLPEGVDKVPKERADG